MTGKQHEQLLRSITSMHERANKLIDPLMTKHERRTISPTDQRILGNLLRMEAAIGDMRRSLYR